MTVSRTCPAILRMRDWLAGQYGAVVFEADDEVVASDEIHLRQLFVVRHRRRQGIGRRALEILRLEIWPKDKRVTVEVLVANQSAVAFWRGGWLRGLQSQAGDYPRTMNANQLAWQQRGFILTEGNQHQI